jgi:hypothetical protein
MVASTMVAHHTASLITASAGGRSMTPAPDLRHGVHNRDVGPGPQGPSGGLPAMLHAGDFAETGSEPKGNGLKDLRETGPQPKRCREAISK